MFVLDLCVFLMIRRPRRSTLTATLFPYTSLLRSLARALVEPGRALAEVMGAAMHVGVILLVGAAHRIEHLSRLLRRGGAVEEHQRTAMYRAGEDGKVAPDPLHVVGRGGSRRPLRLRRTRHFVHFRPPSSSPAASQLRVPSPKIGSTSRRNKECQYV